MPPVVLLHGGPGSSASLLPLIATLSERRRVIAPDTPGCGNSDPLPAAETSIIDYAEALQQLLHALAVPCADIYGHHTGAQIACEFAIAVPDTVRRLVLDGVGLFSAELRADFLERYAPPVTPADDGTHLALVWAFVRNLTRYFPHYLHDDDHRTAEGACLPAPVATDLAGEILQGWRTWHRAYGAAFRHELARRLRLVGQETLVLETAGDPLARYARAAADLLPRGSSVQTTRSERAAHIGSYLAG